MENFEEFVFEDDFDRFADSKTPYRSQHDPMITIQRTGAVTLNKKAYLALNSPEYVQLFFHRSRPVIGICSCTSKDRDCFSIRPQRTTTYRISASGFMKAHRVDTSVMQRYKPSLQKDRLFIDLEKATIGESKIPKDNAQQAQQPTAHDTTTNPKDSSLSALKISSEDAKKAMRDLLRRQKQGEDIEGLLGL